MNWLAEYLLNVTDIERQKIIQEFIPLVRFRREFDNFLSEIVTAEDKHPRYNAFWNLWSLMQDSIFQTFEKNLVHHGKLGDKPLVEGKDR